MNMNLFVWFMKAKVYKVESCTQSSQALKFPKREMLAGDAPKAANNSRAVWKGGLKFALFRLLEMHRRVSFMLLANRAHVIMVSLS